MPGLRASSSVQHHSAADALHDGAKDMGLSALLSGCCQLCVQELHCKAQDTMLKAKALAKAHCGSPVFLLPHGAPTPSHSMSTLREPDHAANHFGNCRQIARAIASEPNIGSSFLVLDVSAQWTVLHQVTSSASIALPNRSGPLVPIHAHAHLGSGWRQHSAVCGSAKGRR